MTSQLITSPSGKAPHMVMWLALFWAFSYLLLSVRAQLIDSDAVEWFSELRIISITAGVMLLALALRSAQRLSMKLNRPALLALHIFGASLALLLLRILIAPSTDAAAPAVGDHARWVLVWAGYFGIWLAAFLAVNDWNARPATRENFHSGPIASASNPPLSNDDALERAASLLAADRDLQKNKTLPKLIAALRSQAGYELADPVDAALVDKHAHAAMLHRFADQLQHGLERTKGV
ncbi:MAG: hypothetical protein SFV20_05980 [Sphingopyxis sp.]|nr:hypothetical protein [Sphingopyxis sp.]